MRAETGTTRSERTRTLDSTPKYMIGVAAALLQVHPQTLRMYESRGIVRPRRTSGGTRLYSDVDLARVRRVTELSGGLGLSLQGAEYALELEDELARRSRRIAELEAALEEAAERRRRDLDDVHRSYRRELVLYRPPGGAVVRRTAGSSRPPSTSELPLHP